MSDEISDTQPNKMADQEPESIEVEVGIVDANGKRSVTFATNVDNIDYEAAMDMDVESSTAENDKDGNGDHDKTSETNVAQRQGSFMDRRSQWPRRLSERRRDDHLAKLIRMREKSMRELFPDSSKDSGRSAAEDLESGEVRAVPSEEKERMDAERKKTLEMHSEFVRKIQAHLDNNIRGDIKFAMPAVEIRLQNVSYRVPSLDNGSGKRRIETVYNTSILYKIHKLLRRLKKSKDTNAPKTRSITKVLTDVNLVLKPQKMYLVLGPPLSGKTSLLKAIAGLLPQGVFPSGYSSENKKFLTGRVLYNNIVCLGDEVDESQRTLLENLVAFVRQNDAHAPRLTVGETFQFSGSCKDSNILKKNVAVNPDGRVGLTLDGLGLSHVKDTFVGNEQVRGVSGGQRRRVTLGEVSLWLVRLCVAKNSEKSCQHHFNLSFLISKNGNVILCPQDDGL